jgi:hypothetical protein
MISTLLGNKSAVYIPQYVAPAAVDAGLPESSLPALFTGLTAGSFTSVPGISPSIIEAVIHATRAAYAKSFYVIYLSMLPFGVLLLVAAFFRPNVEDYLTNDVARKLQPNHAVENAKLDEEHAVVVAEK